MYRTVFISYRVADTRTTAGRLAGDLRHVFGDAAVFLDYRSLDPAEQWPAQLQTEVAGAAAVFVLIGKDWLTSQDEYGRRRLDIPNDWVRQEVAAALRGDGKVLPLLVNDTKPLPAAAIENLPDIAALATAQARPLRDVDWEADFSGLVDWLEAQGFEPVAAAVAQDDSTPPAPLWQGNPYRGLSAFRAEDVLIYFGRERETDALVRRVGAPGGRVVAVIGPSGSGKSSLVAAGLLPQLEAGALPGSEGWVCVRFTPAEAGDDPFRALALRLGPRLPGGPSPAELAGRLRSSPEAIDTLAAEVLAGRPAAAELLLFADQFEELFSPRVAEAHRAPFVALVAAVAASNRTRLVLTLRADYTEHCTGFEALTTHVLNSGACFLGAPGLTALQAMVERPARVAGLAVEAALVDRVLNDAGSEPGALALVEFTLERIYDARADGTLTFAAYEALGGVGGAIEAQGERAVADAGGAVDQAALGSVFRALAAVDATGGAVRKRSPLEALGAGARAIVDRLVEARLLVMDTDADGAATVEVAHEAVLRHWQRFRRWLDENRELELWRQRLAVYREGGEPLPRGVPLASALQWLKSRAADLDEAERAYIVGSRTAARRFYGWATAGLLSVLLVMVTVGAFYVWTAQNNIRGPEGLAVLAVWAGLSGSEMVAIPGGAFQMGSPDNEEKRRSNEGPQREVRIRAFAMGKTEVTFAEYYWFAKGTGRDFPSGEGWGRGNRPVINVSWDDAKAYAEWLSKRTGKSYRLPTEAEWEYAARAGSETPFSFGDDEAALGKHAWFSRNSEGKTQEVGTRKPNEFGLHDMHGNVSEWVQDCWQESYSGAPKDGSAWLGADEGDCRQRVIRGGSWDFGPGGLSSSFRLRGAPVGGSRSLGFRLAQDR